MLVYFWGDFSTFASLFVEKWAGFISHIYVFCFDFVFSWAGLKTVCHYSESKFASNESKNFLFQGHDIQYKNKGIESRCMKF